MKNEKILNINNRDYKLPEKNVTVICLDGSDPSYLEIAISQGYMPNLKKIIKNGTSRVSHCVIPSFTNPNNISIATGQPPSVHGICGNYFYDPEEKKEIMMNDVKFLRAPTIFSKFYKNGEKVAVITAKEKLRKLLGAGLSFNDNRAICFSSELASKTNLNENGISKVTDYISENQPNIYSAELSKFVFQAGIKILKEWKPKILYLSTTDFIQHKYSPDDKVAKNFYFEIDKFIGIINDLGSTLILTADHGMNSKHDRLGKPNIVYIQDLFDEWVGKSNSRVILPITDPYVLHHGSLGSFATVYLPKDVNFKEIIIKLKKISGIGFVMKSNDAVKKFELPKDRIGDLVIISTKNSTIGKSKKDHNLDNLTEPLRSHGGISEIKVPFIVNKKIKLPPSSKLKNYDAFYFACNADNM